MCAQNHQTIFPCEKIHVLYLQFLLDPSKMSHYISKSPISLSAHSSCSAFRIWLIACQSGHGNPQIVMSARSTVPVQTCASVASFMDAFIEWGGGPANKRRDICIRCMLFAEREQLHPPITKKKSRKKRYQRWTKRAGTNPSLWARWEKGLIWVGEWVKIGKERVCAGSLRR